jgi:hypothetical protein
MKYRLRTESPARIVLSFSMPERAVVIAFLGISGFSVCRTVGIDRVHFRRRKRSGWLFS